MADKKQYSDPNPQNIPNNSENDDIFGGSYDVFENSEILEPIKELSDNLEMEKEKDEEFSKENFGDSFDEVKKDVVETQTEYQADDSWNTNTDNSLDQDEQKLEEIQQVDTEYDFDEVSQDDEIQSDEAPISNEETLEQDNFEQIELKPDLEQKVAIDPSWEQEEDKFKVDESWKIPQKDGEDDLINASSEDVSFEDEIQKQSDLDQLDDELGFDLQGDGKIDPEIIQGEIEDNEYKIPNIQPEIVEEEIEQDEDEDIEQDSFKESDISQDLEPEVKIDPSWEQEEESFKADDSMDNQEEKTKDALVEEEIDQDIKPILDPEEEEDEDEEEVVEEDEIEEEEKEEDKLEENSPEIYKDTSDLQKKFYELITETKNIHELVNKDLSEGFDLLGGNDDRKKTMYKIFVGDDFVDINKEETAKEDESKQEHLLGFVLEDKSLKISVDDELLYDEIEDLIENPGKKMQVTEKLNKFIFLVTEEYKKIEKQKKEKEKRNQIKGVFRNF